MSSRRSSGKHGVRESRAFFKRWRSRLHRVIVEFPTEWVVSRRSQDLLRGLPAIAAGIGAAIAVYAAHSPVGRTANLQAYEKLIREIDKKHDAGQADEDELAAAELYARKLLALSPATRRFSFQHAQALARPQRVGQC